MGFFLLYFGAHLRSPTALRHLVYQHLRHLLRHFYHHQVTVQVGSGGWFCRHSYLASRWSPSRRLLVSSRRCGRSATCWMRSISSPTT